MSGKLRILVVEDSETQALALAYILEKEGLDVTIVPDSEKAFQCLTRENFDAAVVDYHLPGMQGDELCRRIRQYVGTRGLPVVMLTSENAEIKAIDSGADVYVSKPIDQDILLVRIKALLNRRNPLQEPVTIEGISLRQARILAVDDSPTYLAYLVGILVEEGYIVSQANSGQEALQKMKEESFDAVILDLVMPGMDGIEVCQTINNLQSTDADPIVMLLLTAHENKDEMTRGLAAGADDFVGKSSDLAVLKARIRALLRRKFLQDENKRIVEELKNKELETLRARARQEVVEARAALVEELERSSSELRSSNDQLEKARSEAFKASESKSQFLATMSHEIRTPINGVIGMASLLEDTRLDAQQSDFVMSIKRSAEALLTVINDILDFSKVEAGKLDLEIVDFDLEQLILDAEKTIAFSASQKGLKLSLTRPENLKYMVGGDPGRVRQILLNLLSNAIKFTHVGQVQLRVTILNETEQNIRFLFEVQDSGIGIPAHALERMFKAFSQADASTTRRFGGTGLGLSICKRLVELMDGEIGVNSTEDKGSIFWFTLPLVKRAMRVPQDSSNEERVSNASAITGRILVAEDNFINQRVALGMLEKMGHKAVAVGNGNEVLDALRTMPFDLVLMDCHMPEMDGYEATALIRSSKTLLNTRIPIIAMTANAIKGDMEKCLSVGMDDYVSKPVGRDKLQAVIAKWLRAAQGEPEQDRKTGS
jgi:two-component system sensor histidine kinase/response regulator